MKRCDDFRMLLSPWHDQETSAEVNAEVEAHLEDCSSCAAEVAAMRKIDDLLALQVDTFDLNERVLSEIRNRRPGLTRISHQLPAAAGDATRPATFSHIGVLDGLSNTTPRPSDRKSHWARHLTALATKAGEKCGLAWWLRTAAAVIVSVGIGFAAGGAMTGDTLGAQEPAQRVAVLGMIDDHFGSNALVGIDDLARDLGRGGRQ